MAIAGCLEALPREFHLVDTKFTLGQLITHGARSPPFLLASREVPLVA